VKTRSHLRVAIFLVVVRRGFMTLLYPKELFQFLYINSQT